LLAPGRTARDSLPKVSGDFLLSSFVYFGAFAILMIVISHCYGLVGFARDDTASIFLGNLFTGRTTFFVFVSGYLFHHIFYRRYAYRTFLEGKFRTLLAPYVLMATLALVVTIWSDPELALFANRSVLELATGPKPG
jgi:fucose 4-O-acetylase-like acetyltransferase